MEILRVLLAISVVLAHSTPILGCSLVGGPVAVQVFYIISGFYMSLILNEKYINQNNSYRLFLSNRFLRLFPVYLVVLLLVLLTSVAVLCLYGDTHKNPLHAYFEYSGSLSPGSFIFLVFTNIFIFFQDVVMFLGIDISTGHLFFTENFQNHSPALHQFLLIPQAWTIGVELTFYLLAPFIVRRKLFLVGILMLLSLALRLILYRSGLNHDPWTYRFFPTELVFFLMGNVSYRIYQKLKNIQIKPLLTKGILLGLLSCTLLYDRVDGPFKMYVYFLLSILALPFIFRLTKNWKWDAHIGELSYPIYICHIFVLFCITRFHIPLIHGNLGFTLTLWTIVLSILLNYFVARRIEAYRQKRVVVQTLRFQSSEMN
ncbi:MAG TPA: acyltransferase [Bacteroides graminisolvens]|uniref:Acyltransferase n=1 Tax=Bacteroides graminisolvens TaxID=477666 RepID=A0A3D2SD21_9BACE|nr:acyltransferase [Bacteroides graminisolvens]